MKYKYYYIAVNEQLFVKKESNYRRIQVKKKQQTLGVANTSEEKKKRWMQRSQKFEKDFGKGAVMKLRGVRSTCECRDCADRMSESGSCAGTGRCSERTWIEVYGPESSGKTTIALHMIAEVQKRGGIAGFVDAEHALDPVYAKNIGVDIDELYISQPDSGDQALEIAETMVRSGAIDIIVIDSVAALVPKQEIEGIWETAMWVCRQD